MEILTQFFMQYGLGCSLIAIGGIIVLGLLKYFKCFEKYDEDTRHKLYIIISVGISLIGTLIYELVLGQFDLTTFFALGSALFALNQGFYSIFATTPINKWAGTLLTMFLEFVGVVGTEKKTEPAALGDGEVVEIKGEPVEENEKDDDESEEDNPEA